MRDPDKRQRSPMIYWIDPTAGVAYISLRAKRSSFGEFLGAVDGLISHPDWRPGMPVIEDRRRCRWVPPGTALEEWRAYISAHQALLAGCRWAVVTRPATKSAVVCLLNAAAGDAAPSGVPLQQFTNMLDAHLWVKPPGVSFPRLSLD